MRLSWVHRKVAIAEGWPLREVGVQYSGSCHLWRGCASGHCRSEYMDHLLRLKKVAVILQRVTLYVERWLLVEV